MAERLLVSPPLLPHEPVVGIKAFAGFLNAHELMNQEISLPDNFPSERISY